MACFWNGILARLTPTERRSMGPGPADLKRFLRSANRPSRRCRWQGQPRSEAEIAEAVAWIRDDTADVHGGHLTSSCDPYLCLLVELLGVDVVHMYNGARIVYQCDPPPQARPGTPRRRTLRFGSTRSHFYAA